ncbi:MAG: hypothetical protein Q7R96_01400 [Nanoarchaeota archaeon]|nr:hypothetical protein [Nanoarchaeota archaeon]
MKLVRLSRKDKLPKGLNPREEFVLKRGKDILGYVSFFVQSNQLVLEHVAVVKENAGLESALMQLVLEEGFKRKLESVHFVKEIAGIDHLKFHHGSIAIFTKRLVPERQKDIKHILQELEAQERLSEGLRELPTK